MCKTAGQRGRATFPVATAHNIYTYYAKGDLFWKIFVGHTPHIWCWNQKPVGERMPTQTVYLREELYEYVLTTTDDEQSTSARVSELVAKGKGVEQNE